MYEVNACINLNLYRVFYCVAKEKSISKAAKKLYISQPAISKSLKKLEEELDVELFTRSLNGVILTEAGKMLFQYVEKAGKEIMMAERALKGYKYNLKEAETNWYVI